MIASFEDRESRRKEIVNCLLLGGVVFALLIVVQILIAHAPASPLGAVVKGVLYPGFWIAFEALSKAFGTNPVAQRGLGVAVLIAVSAGVDIAIYGTVILLIRRVVASGRGVV